MQSNFQCTNNSTPEQLTAAQMPASIALRWPGKDCNSRSEVKHLFQAKETVPILISAMPLGKKTFDTVDKPSVTGKRKLTPHWISLLL